MVVDTKPQEKKLPVHKSIYLLPNLITSLSMFMGFLSMVWAVQSRFEEAGLAIVLSALLDGMDGKVARLTRNSYFTMLGLAESGREDLLKCMADNFAWMIEIYGHIPNGNRTYYLSRSQPPVFALMVELFEEDGVRGAKRYLDHLQMEYSFWMDGAESLIPNLRLRGPTDNRVTD